MTVVVFVGVMLPSAMAVTAMLLVVVVVVLMMMLIMMTVMTEHKS